MSSTHPEGEAALSTEVSISTDRRCRIEIPTVLQDLKLMRAREKNRAMRKQTSPETAMI